MKCLTCHGLITNGNCGCSTGTQGAASVNIDIMLRDRDAEIAALKARAERAEAERDHALAACAEMRAVLTEIREWRRASVGLVPQPKTDAETLGARIDAALLSHTDLGRGWASPELVRRCRDVLTELAPTCRCDEAWTSRGRHEVNALCHMEDDATAAIADLNALLDGGKGRG